MVSSNKIESVIKIFQQQSPEPEDFIGEFYQKCKVHTYPSQITSKNWRWENTSECLRTTSSWYQNQTNISHTHTKWQTNITDEHRFKNAQENISKLNNTLKGSYTIVKWDLFPGKQG